MPYHRLVGRSSIPSSWSEEQRSHYLKTPDDPRYLTLSEEIVREIDPRYMGDDLMKALYIKRWLEREGFYTRKEKHRDEQDPTGDFLFGNLRGYCVHFAHAAAQLFRAQGIASRVALGYAENLLQHSGGSSLLIMADRAHAWPEIHIEGVGWLTFDIYPERSDEPPRRQIHVSLENLMGELARDDQSGGRAADPEFRLEIPWALLARWAGRLLLSLLFLAYLIKLSRLFQPLLVTQGRKNGRIFARALDPFSDVGIPRQRGESRERYAQRLEILSPSLMSLTQQHLRIAWGAGPCPDGLRNLRALERQVSRERRAALPAWRLLLGWLNPLGWYFTR